MSDLTYNERYWYRLTPEPCGHVRVGRHGVRYAVADLQRWISRGKEMGHDSEMEPVPRRGKKFVVNDLERLMSAIRNFVEERTNQK